MVHICAEGCCRWTPRRKEEPLRKLPTWPLDKNNYESSTKAIKFFDWNFSYRLCIKALHEQ